MSPDLAQMLGAQAPPQTPMSALTPDIRKNPTHEWYVSLQRVRMTTRDALVKSDEQEPAVKDFLTAVRGICDKLLSGGNPRASIASGLARAVEGWAPQAAGQLDMAAMQILFQTQQSSMSPAGPGGMGMPGQTGMPPGAPPQGGPPMGGPPAPPAGPAGAAL